MASFSELFKRAWGVVFYSQKSFWTLFILSNVVNFVAMGILYITGYNPMNQADMLRMISEIWPYVYLMLGTVIFGTIFGFFGHLYLSQIFLGKGTSFQTTLLSWKRILPAIGTYFCGLLFGIGICLLFIIGIAIWIWIDVLLAIPYGIFVFCAFIWSVVTFFAFYFPAFFLDDVRYFNVLITSMKMVRGRWWRTFGKIFFILLCAMIIIMPLSSVSSAMVMEGTANGLTLIIIASIQSIAGMCILAFTYALYEDYKKHPIVKIVENKNILPKKKAIKKKTSKTTTK